MQRAFHRAAERGLRSTVYTRDLFATGNDIDNRDAVARVSTADLDVVGFAVAGTARVVDKALDGLRLHHSHWGRAHVGRLGRLAVAIAVAPRLTSTAR